MYVDDIQVPVFTFVCCVFHWEEGKICIKGSNFVSLMLSSHTLCTVIIMIFVALSNIKNNNREDVCALMAIFVLIKSHQKKGRREHIVSEHYDEFTWALWILAGWSWSKISSLKTWNFIWWATTMRPSAFHFSHKTYDDSSQFRSSLAHENSLTTLLTWTFV